MLYMKLLTNILIFFCKINRVFDKGWHLINDLYGHLKLKDFNLNYYIRLPLLTCITLCAERKLLTGLWDGAGIDISPCRNG